MSVPDAPAAPAPVPLPFRIRGMVLFPAAAIAAQTRFGITIIPVKDRGDAYLERIVFQRPCAQRLILEGITVGGMEIVRGPLGGAGTCEVFLAENVPNWTPEGIVLRHDKPMIIHVFNPAAAVNPSASLIRLAGQCVVRYRGELPV